MNAKKLHLFEYNCLSYFLIRGAFIGICLNNLLIISKQDSWLSVILAFILGFIPLGIFYLIIKDNPKGNIIDFIKNNCGNTLGNIINVLISIFIFIFTSLLMWNLINFISSQYLYKTPNLAISITFAIAIYYICSKSINVIGRTTVILFYISAILFILSALGLSFQLDLNNLKPTLEYGINPIFTGSLQYISYNILPLFLITIIPKEQISDKNKKFIRNGIITYVISSFSLFVVSFFLVSIYGIEFSQILQYPSYHILKRLSILGFIQRVESISSIQWILDLFVIIVMGIYFIKTSIVQTFNIKPFKFISFFLVTLLIIVTNYLFKNNTIGNSVILHIFPFFNYLFFLIIPTLIYFKKKISQ